MPSASYKNPVTRSTMVTWMNMMSRCFQPNHERYSSYGGIGINVCDRWMEFDLFVEDMGLRPIGKTLDRIDSLQSYCKENCRWATPREQTLNRKCTRFIEYDGRTMCIMDWARELGIKQNTLYKRLDSMTFQEAIAAPVRKWCRRKNLQNHSAS